MKTYIFSLVLLLFPGVAFAGGCLPGEPCDDLPKVAAPESAQIVAPVAVSEDEAYFNEQPLYVFLSGGWTFHEKDEEVLGHQRYEVGVGAYRAFAGDRLSIEASFAIMPDVRARKWPDQGRFKLDDDSEGLGARAELLYHLVTEEDAESIDPFLAFGGGVNWYDDSLKDGHSRVMATLGAGAFVNLTDRWFVRPDYRVAMAGENTEVNQLVSVGVGYRFGCDTD